jgi:hypothetical protein
MSEGGTEEARPARPEPGAPLPDPVALVRDRLNSRQQFGQRHSSTSEPSARL